MLTFDLYLRENMKTRPDFAPEQEGVKKCSGNSLFANPNSIGISKGTPMRGCDWKSISRMTHIEEIGFDRKTGNRLTEKQYILFDYQHRNPLTGDATCIRVEPHCLQKSD